MTAVADTQATFALEREAELFAIYIISAKPTPQVAALYLDAIRCVPDLQDHSDDRLLAFALRHPRSIPFLDSALALRNPQALLRRRVAAMFAILECQTDHCDRFLAENHSIFDLVLLGIQVMRSALHVAGGLMLLRVIGK